MQWTLYQVLRDALEQTSWNYLVTQCQLHLHFIYITFSLQGFLWPAVQTV